MNCVCSGYLRRNQYHKAIFVGIKVQKAHQFKNGSFSCRPVQTLAWWLSNQHTHYTMAMGRLSFFTAAHVGGGAIASTVGGEEEDTYKARVIEGNFLAALTREDNNSSERNSSAAFKMARPQQQQQRRRRPNIQSVGSRSLSLNFLAALLLCMTAFAAAQDECNCSPVQYTFRLNLGAIACPEPPNSFGADAVAYFGPGVNENVSYSLH